MNIGIVTQRLTMGDGQGSINLAVAEAALDRGHTLTLLASEVAPALLDHPSVTWVEISPGGWPTQLLRDQVFAWKSHRWLQSHRSTLDLLMVNGAITWSPADVNALHFVHDAWMRSEVHTNDLRSGLHRGYHSLYTRINVAWERWSLRHARHAVAVSSMVEDQIRAIDPNIPVHVIPNGVDPTIFTPTGPTLDRSALGCPEDAPLAVFAGDIRTALKNLDTVLHALRRVPSLHLAVAGDPTDSPFPALATELGLDARVHFLGFRRDIPALMRTADMLVFPSRYESFSLVLLEAMASETPVITAKTVGAADLLTPECGMVLDDPNDVEALAESMRLLALNPERREEMGRAARAVACRYDIRRTAARYVDLFETLHGPEPERRAPALDAPARTPSVSTAVRVPATRPED